MSDDRMDAREVIARRLQQAGRAVAGERGSRIANGISAAIGCGRIETCDDPTCPNCGPAVPIGQPSPQATPSPPPTPEGR